MDTDRFDYHLPPERIAQEPLPERDQSRLLVFERASGRISHRRFFELPDLLGPGDTLFRNNVSVLPARLPALRPTGGRVECLLHRPTEDPNLWHCLLKPGRKLQDGSPFGIPEVYTASVIQREGDGYLVRFELFTDQDVVALARRIGAVPLPPYIERSSTDPRRASDAARYQTVYADAQRPVAVAAPTAGLHFTPRLIDTLKHKGLRFADVCLHVGMGTFKPIQSSSIEEHRIHSELYEVTEAAARASLQPDGGRRIAVGTTVVRTLEDLHRRCQGRVPPGTFRSESSLFLYPPAQFSAVDALITNFHQPRSTLLCLVAAFLDPGGLNGIERLHELYREALRGDYRFLSYGDAMLIL